MGQIEWCLTVRVEIFARHLLTMFFYFNYLFYDFIYYYLFFITLDFIFIIYNIKTA